MEYSVTSGMSTTLPMFAPQWQVKTPTLISSSVTSRSSGYTLSVSSLPRLDLRRAPVRALAPLALFAEGATTIRSVANLRVKETDRLAALAAELRKFGAEVDERADGLRITPPAEPVAASVATYDDHRMAMGLALCGLKIPGVEITGAECVGKTFPNYFDCLRDLVGS